MCWTLFTNRSFVAFRDDMSTLTAMPALNLHVPSVFKSWRMTFLKHNAEKYHDFKRFIIKSLHLHAVRMHPSFIDLFHSQQIRTNARALIAQEPIITSKVYDSELLSAFVTIQQYLLSSSTRRSIEARQVHCRWHDRQLLHYSIRLQKPESCRLCFVLMPPVEEGDINNIQAHIKRITALNKGNSKIIALRFLSGAFYSVMICNWCAQITKGEYVFLPVQPSTPHKSCLGEK